MFPNSLRCHHHTSTKLYCLSVNGFWPINFYFNNTHRHMYRNTFTLDPYSYCKLCLSRKNHTKHVQWVPRYPVYCDNVGGSILNLKCVSLIGLLHIQQNMQRLDSHRNSRIPPYHTFLGKKKYPHRWAQNCLLTYSTNFYQN